MFGCSAYGFLRSQVLRVTLVIPAPGNAARPYIFHQDTLLLAAAGLKIAAGDATGCVAAGRRCVSRGGQGGTLPMPPA